MGIISNQSIKNSMYFYIGLVFGCLSTIIFYPNTFNESPENLGLLQIILAYSTVISTVSFIGMPKTIIRFFPYFDNKNQLISFSLLVSIFGFLLVFVTFLIFRDEIYNLIGADILLKKYFYLVFILVILLSFFEIFSSLSRSLLDSSTPIFIREVFLKGSTIFLLFLHWFDFISFSVFLHLYIFIYFIMVIILIISTIKSFRYRLTFIFNEVNIKRLFRYGFFVLIGGASAIIVSRVDMIMIGKYVGLTEVAYYSVAFFIGNVIRVPARALGSIASPIISRAWKESDMQKIYDIYYKSSINQLIFGGFIFLIVWLNIDDALLFLPEKFRGGKLVVLFIALSQLFNVTTGVNGKIIINSKFYKFDLYSNIILLVITLFTNYLFIRDTSPLFEYGIYGINGAAFATALSIFIFNFIKLLYLYIKIKIHPFTIKTLFTLILLIVIYFLINFICFPENLFLRIFLKSFTIFLLYFSLVFVFKLSIDIENIVKKKLNMIT